MLSFSQQSTQVTAQLLRDVGEQRRKRLRPQGRKGLPDVSAWHGVKVDPKIKKVCALALPYHGIKGRLENAVDGCFSKVSDGGWCWCWVVVVVVGVAVGGGVVRRFMISIMS